jgi:glycosyltransferase involved in cell wall biosynthesis
MEAQASGIAPIVMRCGGSDELVEHGATGWLVDQGDEEGFVRTLREVLANDELRRRVGRAARAEVLASSSHEAFDRAIARAYEGISKVTEPARNGKRAGSNGGAGRRNL